MKKLFFALSLVMTSSLLFAQLPEQWKSTVQGNVNWQHVTPAGNYLVGSSAGLVCLEQESGRVLWISPSHANILPEQIEQNGPLLTIHQPDHLEMLNPFNGQVAFDSRKSGIAEVVDAYYLPNANGMLISGMASGAKPLMVFADLSSGEVKWKIDEDFGRVIHASEISGNEALIVTLWNNYRVDAATGKTIWKVATLENKLEGALGSLMKNIATQQANQMDINVAFYRHPKKPVFYIAAQKEQTSGFTSTSSAGAPSVNYVTEYTAFDIATGEKIWKAPAQVQGAISQVYFHDKGLAVLPDNGGSTSVNLLSYETGEGLWGKKGRGIRVKGGIYDYIVAGKGLVLISNNGGKNYLSYLDTSQGLLTFDKPVKVDGEVLFTEETARGILYVTTEELNILDPVSGSLLFPKSIATNNSLTAHFDDELFVYDLREQHLKRINKATGDIRIASPAIVFEGKESPRGIEVREEGIFIYSDQNAALVGLDGQKIYQNYFEAPREPGLKRALLYAEAVRAAYISAAAYSASAQLRGAAPKVRKEDAVAGEIVDSFGQMYGQLGDAANDLARQSWSQASARFKATAQSRDFMVVLMQRENKENSLAVIDKRTGQINSYINLGKERMPDYAMDDITGKVFYRTSANTIAGFDLN